MADYVTLYRLGLGKTGRERQAEYQKWLHQSIPEDKGSLWVDMLDRQEQLGTGPHFPVVEELNNWGRVESAGINRHRVGDERALHERSS